jgi:hypothetical protein
LAASGHFPARLARAGSSLAAAGISGGRPSQYRIARRIVDPSDELLSLTAYLRLSGAPVFSR